MAIEPVCDKCKKELEDFGALLFSPPDEDNNTRKFHLCRKCYTEIIEKNELL
ncbi:hypothetical protein J4408_03115 [Candidatus Pacearchaeota archaeon]|nr:hypothetical protein [Candidatus Pacearchaeota archaeon]